MNDSEHIDTLIRQALVFDGSGREPVVSDVAIANGRIAAIGTSLKVNAKQVIDAKGLALMPGSSHRTAKLKMNRIMMRSLLTEPAAAPDALRS